MSETPKSPEATDAAAAEQARVDEENRRAQARADGRDPDAPDEPAPPTDADDTSSSS